MKRKLSMKTHIIFVEEISLFNLAMHWTNIENRKPNMHVKTIEHSLEHHFMWYIAS